jgi:hypothetical protein
MYHRLLVATLIVTEIRVFLQSLSQTSHIAMPENTEAAAKIRLLDAVTLDILIF